MSQEQAEEMDDFFVPNTKFAKPEKAEVESAVALAIVGERESKKEAAVEAMADYTEARLEMQRIEADADEARNAIMAKVEDELAKLGAEYAPVLEAESKKVQLAEARLKKAVLDLGESYTGEVFHAVYSAGSPSWDKRLLDQYSREHPEIRLLRTDPVPSVSVRVSK